MPNVFATNRTSSSITVAGHKVYYIDSADAEIVEVQDGNNVKFNAFKYTLSGTPYWYVIDGEHDTWTDDLSVWGYSEVHPVVELPTVSLTDDFMAFGSGDANNWLGFNNSLSPVTVSPLSSSEYSLKIWNTSLDTTYDSTKSYGVVSYQISSSAYGSVRDAINIVQSYGHLSVYNKTNESIVVRGVRVAVCSSNQATVVTVYDSSNVAYNAFKYTTNNTDYYYVLDSTQTDWTDDLSSIGYSLTPVTKRGYAYKNMRYYYGDECELTYTAAGSDYIPANAAKRYVVVSISSTPEFDASTIELFNGTSPSRLSARCYSPFNGSLWYVDYYEVDA